MYRAYVEYPGGTVVRSLVKTEYQAKVFIQDELWSAALRCKKYPTAWGWTEVTDG